MPAMVENRYRMDVARRRDSSEQHLAELYGLLHRLLAGFEGEAWVGGGSDEARRELEDHRSNLLRVMDFIRNEYGFVLSVQPVLIEDGTWQAHWISR